MHLSILPGNDEIRNIYEMHTHYHVGDSGLDLFFMDDINIDAGETKIIDLKIRCEAFPDRDKNTNISYYLYPRSSISKTPLRMSNSVGIIDAGYRGTIKVSVDNVSEENYVIQKGDRLFQICSPTLSPVTFQLTNQLSRTSRGEGGFGSTG
jgi:dUTP pyrophosphatase